METENTLPDQISRRGSISAQLLPDEVTTLVVGTGPAGVMAAVGAAARGPVLMIDAFTLPRDKSCGGMIHPLSSEVLAPFGGVPESLLLTPAQVSFRYNDWDRGIIRDTDLYFLNVDRKPFDDWLLSLVPDAVRIADATRFVDWTPAPDGRIQARLSCRDADGSARDVTVTCSYLVGADGPRSTVRRSLAVPDTPHYITVQDYCRRVGELDPVFDCFWFSGIPGFAIGYVIPKNDRALVGLVYHPGTKRAHELQDRALDKLRERLPIGESLKREAWTAPRHRNLRDVVAGTGSVLLCGEAGGFISPTSGEGISWALRSGRSAGAAIAACDPPDVLAAYSRDVEPLRRDIERRLRWFPWMNSRVGKTLAGMAPPAWVSKMTHNL